MEKTKKELLHQSESFLEEYVGQWKITQEMKDAILKSLNESPDWNWFFDFLYKKLWMKIDIKDRESIKKMIEKKWLNFDELWSDYTKFLWSHSKMKVRKEKNKRLYNKNKELDRKNKELERQNSELLEEKSKREALNEEMVMPKGGEMERLKYLADKTKEWVNKYNKERKNIVNELMGKELSKPIELLLRWKKKWFNGLSINNPEAFPKMKSEFFKLLQPITDFFEKLYENWCSSSVVKYFQTELIESQILWLQEPRGGSYSGPHIKSVPYGWYLPCTLWKIESEYLEGIWIPSHNDIEDWDSAIYPYSSSFDIEWAKCVDISPVEKQKKLVRIWRYPGVPDTYEDVDKYIWFKDDIVTKNRINKADVVIIYRENDTYQKFHDEMFDLVMHKYGWNVVFVTIPKNFNKDNLSESDLLFLKDILKKGDHCITDNTISKWTWVETKKIEDVLSEGEFKNLGWIFIRQAKSLEEGCIRNWIDEVYIISNTDRNGEFLLEHWWLCQREDGSIYWVEWNERPESYDDAKRFRKNLFPNMKVHFITWDQDWTISVNPHNFKSSLLISDRHCYQPIKQFRNNWGKAISFAWITFEDWIEDFVKSNIWYWEFLANKLFEW